ADRRVMLDAMRRSPTRELRMRIWIGIALTGACVPVASSPGGQAPPPVMAASQPGPPGSQAPDEPWVQLSAAPAAAPVAAAPAAAPADPEPDGDDAGPGAALEPAAANQAAPRGDAAWVEAHNRYRARHCAAALTWSAKLADVAQRWANALRDRGCQFGHSGGS